MPPVAWAKRHPACGGGGARGAGDAGGAALARGAFEATGPAAPQTSASAQGQAAAAEAEAAIAESEKPRAGPPRPPPTPLAVACGPRSCRRRHPPYATRSAGMSSQDSPTTPGGGLSPGGGSGGARHLGGGRGRGLAPTVQAEGGDATTILQAYQVPTTSVEPGGRWLKPPLGTRPRVARAPCTDGGLGTAHGRRLAGRQPQPAIGSPYWLGKNASPKSAHCRRAQFSPCRSVVSRAILRTHTPLTFCSTGAGQHIEACITGEFASRILTIGYTSFRPLERGLVETGFQGVEAIQE